MYRKGLTIPSKLHREPQVRFSETPKPGRRGDRSPVLRRYHVGITDLVDFCVRTASERIRRGCLDSPVLRR